MRPQRPRLADHVFARRHRHDGARIVVLHDTKRDITVRVAERAWTLVSGMDGTRDVDGLTAHVRREGVPIASDEIASFIDQMAAEGLLEDGPTDVAPPTRPTEPAAGAPRPVLAMPRFTLACDGRGTCCRFYPTVVFSPLEAARARARLPLVEDAGMIQRRAFTPLAGTDDRLLAVALVDGRCAYLEADLRCGIHRSGCAEDKPLGCRTYPARFVDDGTAIRVSPWLECPCVLASGERAVADGEPLTRAETSADIDPAIFIETLPERVRVGRAGDADRAELAATMLALSAIEVQDGAAALSSLAAALDTAGLGGAAAALTSPVAPNLASFRPALAAIRPRVERLAAEDWRSSSDLPRRLWSALLGAIDLLEAVPEEILAGPGAYQRAEAFYVRALLFGYQLVHTKGRHSAATLAHDRALRVVLARALGVVSSLADLDDPAFSQPLALVEAASRAYGIGGYLADLGTDAPPALS